MEFLLVHLDLDSPLPQLCQHDAEGGVVIHLGREVSLLLLLGRIAIGFEGSDVPRVDRRLDLGLGLVSPGSELGQSVEPVDLGLVLHPLLSRMIIFVSKKFTQ